MITIRINKGIAHEKFPSTNDKSPSRISTVIVPTKIAKRIVDVMYAKLSLFVKDVTDIPLSLHSYD
ncbi:hypothetical protein NARC_100114 [Candidatus Nitrosocosmicus arcticus]|uniref:Uncharacterized protein n=1 Tax=Candidatus Nitrosocosmicus arcticus TaxID=2035267 RepID=A0A557STW5_9ARCH|nr:hypothetical protein NARC_100114 [Candidatus Nitrosocosmicus arcticus]